MDYMIMLEPEEIVPIEVGPPMKEVFEALEHRYDDKPGKLLVIFPTTRPHPTIRDSAYLIVEIDSIGHGPAGDGSDWLIIGTLSRKGSFWSKSGDSNGNPKVQIVYNSKNQNGVFELHLES